ncbi:hypothetical protein RHSIM_Rhsim13G0198700 [Rhododendron simsii]|uniref:Outer envelope protein 61 n=1 Tax=Rhododendron simsii TaxID=118357 RepID=A0A834FZ90_RHOSS|nr:hypothetical protein RHSIM_Rhsim13G0198700 [Rhododendron simsii]
MDSSCLGNELHSQGRYKEAVQKYLLAKKNLKSIPSSKGRVLLLACSLNMMSCYLKTRQYDECIKEGTEVLAADAENVKALYRRGQAYKELGQLEDAVSNLSKAHEVSPEDETIVDVLRDAKERLVREGGGSTSRRLVVEEITEEEETVSSEIYDGSTAKYSVSPPQETSGSSKSQAGINIEAPSTNAECVQALKDDPEAISMTKIRASVLQIYDLQCELYAQKHTDRFAIDWGFHRSFQNFMYQTDPETLASMSGGNAEGISPDMIKTASNMISRMSPQELQKMLQMASSFQGENNPFVKGVSSDNSFRPGPVPTDLTPDMMKMASDMMSKMPAEELQKMFEMTSSLKGKDSVSTASALKSNGFRSDAGSKQSRESFSVRGDHTGESSSSNGFSNSRSFPQSSFPNSTADLQQQMQNQMNDPAMRQMFTSMIKNMSPDMMANMGEQFGLKLSREDAEKAQQAMSSLSPDTLDKMMKWADRIQRGVEVARKTKNWLLGKPGMIMAIFMLILAFILHRLGYIGS